MKATVLARRYAKALFELAVEKKILDTVAREVETFNKLLREDARMRHFFLSPEAGKTGKKKLLEENFQDQFSALFMNFLLVLLDKGRQGILDDIATEFERLSDDHDKRLRATTTSAVPLTNEDLAEIKRILGKHYDDKAEFEIENFVDASIIGGLILQVEGKVFDASVRSQLDRMRNDLMSQRN